MTKQDPSERKPPRSFILAGIGIGGVVGVLCTTGVAVTICTQLDPDIPCTTSSLGLLLLLLIFVGVLLCGSIGAVITFTQWSAKSQLDVSHKQEPSREKATEQQ